MFPTAMECNCVARLITVVARVVYFLMASCARQASVITSGSGPSSRIDPARTKGILFFRQASIIPFFLIISYQRKIEHLAKQDTDYKIITTMYMNVLNV